MNYAENALLVWFYGSLLVPFVFMFTDDGPFHRKVIAWIAFWPILVPVIAAKIAYKDVLLK